MRTYVGGYLGTARVDSASSGGPRARASERGARGPSMPVDHLRLHEVTERLHLRGRLSVGSQSQRGGDATRRQPLDAGRVPHPHLRQLAALVIPQALPSRREVARHAASHPRTRIRARRDDVCASARTRRKRRHSRSRPGRDSRSRDSIDRGRRPKPSAAALPDAHTTGDTAVHASSKHAARLKGHRSVHQTEHPLTRRPREG